MTAEKANKIYTIGKDQASEYQTAGYDIRDDDGKIIMYGAGKSVSYEEFAKVSAENEALKAELAKIQKPIEGSGEGTGEGKTTSRKKTGE